MHTSARIGGGAKGGSHTSPPPTVLVTMIFRKTLRFLSSTTRTDCSEKTDTRCFRVWLLLSLLLWLLSRLLYLFIALPHLVVDIDDVVVAPVPVPGLPSPFCFPFFLLFFLLCCHSFARPASVSSPRFSVPLTGATARVSCP